MDILTLIEEWQIPRGGDLPDDVRWFHYERAKKIALRVFDPGTPDYERVIRAIANRLGV